MAHLYGLDLGRKRLSHKDRLFKVLEGDFLSSLTLLDQITPEFHHGWWMCSSSDNKAIANRDALAESMGNAEIEAAQDLTRELSKPNNFLIALDKYQYGKK